MELVNDDLKAFINNDSKVVILPWAFPFEIDSDKLINDYFKVGGDRYNRYVNSLKNLGIREDNIYIGNCYTDTSMFLKDKIKNSDILIRLFMIRIYYMI